MSTGKKPVIDAKKALPELKKLGLFKEGKSAINGRKKLTDSQVRRIRKAYDEYAYILNTPKTEFVKKDVSHYDKKDKDALKKAGYKIINDKLWLDKQGSPSVKIERVHVKNNTKKGYGTQIQISRTIKDGTRIETELISEDADKLSWREKLALQYQQGGFKDGEFVGMKIGRGGIFRRQIILSLDDVYKYLEVFEPKDYKTNKRDLLENVILIRFQVRDWRDLGKDMQTDKERNKLARQRRAKAAKVKKATGGKSLSGVAKRKK